MRSFGPSYTNNRSAKPIDRQFSAATATVTVGNDCGKAGLTPIADRVALLFFAAVFSVAVGASIAGGLSYTCANMGCFQQVSYAQQSSAMKGKTESACYGPNAHYSYCEDCDKNPPNPTCNCMPKGFFYEMGDAMAGMLVASSAMYVNTVLIVIAAALFVASQFLAPEELVLRAKSRAPPPPLLESSSNGAP